MNAYGWWTVATIALYVRIALIVAGIVLAIFAILGFRHARWTADVAPTAEVARSEVAA